MTRRATLLLTALLLVGGMAQAQVVIKGNVHGGGLEGKVLNPNAAQEVFGNASVTINGGTIESSVFGGGKGVRTDEKSGLVEGNTTVTMTGGTVERSIYGGGEVGSVGTFNTFINITYPANESNGSEEVVVQVPTDCVAKTGNATVIVTGGSVGLRGSLMPWDNHDPNEDDRGWIFCGGQGEADSILYPKAIAMGVVHDTHLEIKNVTNSEGTIIKAPLITASVYGGCENGLVLDSTYVEIKGGQIGTGYKSKAIPEGGSLYVGTFADPYSEQYWTTAIQAVKDGTIGTALADGGSLHNIFYACDAWEYGHDDDGNPNTPKRYDVYDIFYGQNYTTGPNVGQPYQPDHTAVEGTNGQTFFGNVFGGGSGYYPIAPGVWRRSAGQVNGNTRVEITGGHILTSVYGGNENTDVKGKATVKMSGGTIGVPRLVSVIKEHPVLCNLFGAGKGDQRTWANKWTNVEKTIVEFTGGTIFGSIFGGGEDGHVLGNTYLTVKEDPGKEILIGTYGYTGFEGHVYGSGRGFSGDALTAGGVCGNTNVTIWNGTMLGSVYGGGRNGSVGPKLCNTDELGYGLVQLGDHGKCHVTIKGGTIGNDHEMDDNTLNPGGHVFGGSMGALTILDGTPNNAWARMSRVGSTEIHISQTGTTQSGADTTLIKGNVYGGCGLGTVKDNTKVTIAGGTILGDVFGSGLGSDNTTMVNDNVVGVYDEAGNLTGIQTVSAIPLQRAGLVEGNTEIIMQGGHVKGNVYGGGDVASVGQMEAVKENNVVVDYTPVENTGLAKITITGGQVGDKIDDAPSPKPSAGYVYGGSKGKGNDESNTYKSGANVNSTYVHINMTSTDTINNRIWCCVFGGGADGHVLDTTGILLEKGVIGTYGKYKFEGNIFGGGRNDQGKNYTAGRVGGNVHVTVKDGLVKSNVYGGGNSGLVGADLNGEAYAADADHGNTTVDIKGGKVGIINYGYKHATQLAIESNPENPLPAFDTIINLGDGGNVFGGGRGKKEDADLGRVMRNAYVNISAGHVMNNVYGGGENGSVGQREAITSNNVITDYKPVANTGLAKVNVTGGQVGPAPNMENGYDIPCGLSGENGYVFGGGMGVTKDYIDFTNHPELGPYSGAYYAVADVNYTSVTVNMPMPAENDNNANRIWGSIFGGAEDGHVLGSDTVHFKNGLLGTYGTSSYDGNIFGGGRNYSKANYNAGRVRSNTTVEMTGGQIYGTIFGGGRLALTGVDLYGNVLEDESGENGAKYGLAHVMVKGGKVGNDTDDPEVSGKTYMETFTKYSMGDVFGGGKGSMEGVVGHPKASALLVALVKNTKVEISETDATHHPTRILGSVFGGGEVANVGQFTWNFGVTDPLYGGTSDPTNQSFVPDHPTATTIGNIALVPGTGKTEVTVSGGRIGIDRMQMDLTLVGGTGADKYDLKYHYDVGHVFGGGEGLGGNPDNYATINPSSSTPGIHNNKSLLDLMAVVGETDVTIDGTAFVKGSVYGGSMSGRVLGDTKVKIDGGQIGAGDNGTTDEEPYTPATKFFNPIQYFGTDHPTATDVAAADVLHGCVSWPYSANDQKPFNPIEILAGHTPTNGETWFGHVFGGGSGYYPYIIKNHDQSADSCVWDADAGKVFGHTEVEITGGHILSNVYGGCQTTDVGNYFVADVTYHGTHPEVPVGQLYNNSNIDQSGKAIVKISGGTVGVPRTNSSILAFPYTSNVYGGGQGSFPDQLKALNNVDSTRVTISGSAIVYGMVFGGSQNGHVIDSTKVLVKGGVIGTTGLSGYDGSVFGGGQGSVYTNPNVEMHDDTLYAHAGRVGGHTRVIMSGGKALGNLYGGGLVALTGVDLDGWFDAYTNSSVVYDSTNHGLCKVEVNGGFVGNGFNHGRNLLKNDVANGNVYGGGRGKLDEYHQDDLARSANSAVKISGSPTIYGSVFGGGEMANVGYWRGYDLGWYATKTAATRVTITGSPTIGTALEFKDIANVASYAHDPGNYTYYDTIRFVKYAEAANQTNDTTYLRMLTHTRTGNVFGGGQGEVVIKGSSHKVLGLEQGHCSTTNVNIGGTPTIQGSVFGGSEEGVVWGNTEVHIAGGTIGTTEITPDSLKYNHSTHNWSSLTVNNATYSYGSVFGGSYGKDYYSSFSSLNIPEDELRQAMIDSVNMCAGRVYGNALVDITGGTVRGSVYGGGDMASVGDDMTNTTTKNGVCTVKVSGGEIGLLDGTGLNAYVFGGGKGFYSDPDELRKAYCNVDSTFVTVSGGKIYGSIFGGGNDAHTLGSASVIVHNGANVGTDGLSTWDGNIFGGGRNFLNTNHTNGRVAGNINITMDGGTLQGSIFGGGRLALTGVDVNGFPFLTTNTATQQVYDSIHHGYVHIIVTGGSIGNTDGMDLLTGSDESVGDIFGSGKGDTKAYEDIWAGRVAKTKVEVSGSNTLIYGSVFGGGEMASIGYWDTITNNSIPNGTFMKGTGMSEVIINGGTIGTDTEYSEAYANTDPEVHEWTVYNESDHTLIHTCTGNVFGGCQGDVDPESPSWVSMGRSRTAQVTINGGTIKSYVYGGAEQGTIIGSTHVTVNGGTIGHEVTSPAGSTYLFGGVHGGGYGSHRNDYNNSTIQNDSAVSAKYIAGRVYGNTLVDILGGTIVDVYGGANYAYVGDGVSATKGKTQVNIGNSSQVGNPSVGTTILGQVYAANNHAGTPYGAVKVDVWHTAHTPCPNPNDGSVLGNYYPMPPVWSTNVTTAEQLSSVPHAAGNFALKAVYGGSNHADYQPLTGRSGNEATVHVHECKENTIFDVYGGSNAASVYTNTNVIIDGGHINRVFGGGNGASGISADIHGTASTQINGGLIHELYGGSNTLGLIDNTILTVNEDSECPVVVGDGYGSNNESLVVGDVVTNLYCNNGSGGSYVNFYGGANLAAIYGNVTVNVMGGTYTNLFAGSKGRAATTEEEAYSADIHSFPTEIPNPLPDSASNPDMYRVYRYMQNALEHDHKDLRGTGGKVTLNIYGGKIQNAFGGSDELGAIDSLIMVNVIDTVNLCNLELTNVYGAGRNTVYQPKLKNGQLITSPIVNVIHGDVLGNVYGGGLGATATTYANPVVNIGYSATDHIMDSLKTVYAGAQYGAINFDNAVAHVKGEVYGGGELAGIAGDTHVNMYCGTVGTDGTSGTDGNIFGGGTGAQGNLAAGRVEGNTVVEMRNGTVMGNIYGGGRLGLTGVNASGVMQSGNDHGNTKVMIKGGTVGNVAKIETFTDFSMGNIYGSGKGFLEYKNGTHTPEAILLSGLTKNTTVEISDTLGNHTHVYGIVLGGGELASVGHYTLTKDGEGTITNIATTEGKATVKISGGTIGGDRSRMRYELADPSDSTNWYSKYNDDLGYVYGGGEGWSDDPSLYATVQESAASPMSLLDLIATVQSTDVTITSDTIKSGTNSGTVRKPWVKASVFGGSESGHVRGNTKVTIADGQIGAGYYVKNGQVVDSLYAERLFFNPLDSVVTNSNSLNGTAQWQYGVAEGYTTIFYYPFDPAMIRNGYNLATNAYDSIPSDGKTWFGNVFGGGSGWFPYVKEISTDTDTIIKFKSFWNPLSGKVWGNTEVNITGGHILSNVYGANESTDVGGKAIVKMSGGTVGVPRSPGKVVERPLIGYVFGGGAGDPRPIFDNLTIVDSTNVQVTGGIVYGSVYGGAEDGHVLGDTRVTISETDAVNKPTVIGSTGRSDLDGHVFGGGRNFNYQFYNRAAGRVLGNTTINMRGGKLMGNLYGGGRLGMTGMYPDGDTIPGLAYGYTTVNISGGTIGSAVDTVTIGNVFGGGKGKVDSDGGFWMEGVFYPYDQLLNHYYLGRVKETTVNILNDARVYGSVYGGGEIAKVMRNTHVTVKDGLIGSELTEGNPAKPRYSGNVFGGSKGYTGVYISITNDPGEVFGNTTVNIEGGQVLENVYGGGEIASVVGNAHVNISGGQIGVEQDAQADMSGAYVYGGGLGRPGDDYEYHANVDSTKVTISGGYIVGSVFGGGDNGHVLKSTVVKMTGGTVGQKNTLAQFITDELEHAATHIYTGSILGGGRGIEKDASGNYSDITGLVYGNTNVNISGGTVRHAVYGGGGLSHVGTITTHDADTIIFAPNTGITKVDISGGLIGPKREDLTSPTEAEFTAFFGENVDYDADRYADTAFKYLGGNAGWVFGAGCGLAGNDYKDLTFNDSTVVTMTGGNVVGSLYGGGENGHVARNTNVEITGGTIGSVPLHGTSYTIPAGNVYYDAEHPVTLTLADKDSEIAENEYGVGKRVFRGSVYGGGKGTDYTEENKYSMTAGRVFGNTKVTVSGTALVYDRVYGGGAMSSVGKYTYHSGALPEGLSLGDQLQRVSYVKGTGNTNVIIGGGTVAGGTVGMGSNATDGNNQGYVIGGSRGMSGYPGKVETTPNPTTDEADQVVRMAYVNNTKVTINEGAKVKGNVYGGSVSGHVYGNTHVVVNGGEIGYTYVENNKTKVHDGWHSNVFGGGGGQKSYKRNGEEHLSITAGRVFGNSRVEIKGGTVYHNVYGGGPIASVGTYDLRPSSQANPVAPNTGKTEVIITGGTIGLDGEDNGHVFGSGRGYPAPALEYLDSLSYAVETHVTIGTEGSSDNTTPMVYGSVYGSGENGHTYKKANVTIHSGTVNHSVYGAGEGDDTYKDANNVDRYNPIAGCVQGNTEVKMTGGLVKGNVYGGGRLASVGILLRETQHQNEQYNHADTVVWIAEMVGPELSSEYGNTKVEITGGTIGRIDGHANEPISDAYPRSGFVFGGSKGRLLDATVYERWTDLANVSTTEVIVGGNALVKSSVYGGSEEGRVLDSTWVKIQGGEIGETDKTLRENMAFHRGNVFGGGSGNDSIIIGTGTNQHIEFKREAGRVNGNARVEMSGGHVYNSVYGGCETTSVGLYGIANGTTPAGLPEGALYWIPNDKVSNGGGKATVTISGGVVGWERAANLIENKPRYGYVYGAGKGDPRTDFNTWTNVKETHVTVTTPTSGTVINDTIYGCVFGGGEEGHVLGNTYVKIEGDTLTTWIGTYGSTGADGNVFGSGRGKSPVALTAGGVGGNTRIDVEGGRMLGSIFGGGANSSVGIYFTSPTLDNGSPNPKYGDTITGRDHGYTTVNINAGTIGHGDDGGRTGGNVYGGCRGMAGDEESILPLMAKVKETHVNITQDATVTNDGRQTHIMGSVFGSGEDGHVLKDTYVTVSGGQIGGKKWVASTQEPEPCTDVYHGNVYGGGRGVDQYEDDNHVLHYSVTAGLVSGNTNVTVYGGRIVRSVYGGGNVSSIGDPDDETPDANGNYQTGLATVNILGGIIGFDNEGDENNEYEYKDYGNVFGSGHGGIAGEFVNLAYVKNTHVTVDGSAQIYGSVFGGGEDGHVRHDALVDIKGGTIGQQSEVFLHGNVYGGGRGIIQDVEEISATAGKVNGHTTVNIMESDIVNQATGNKYTPVIWNNVYGGGSRSVVGEYKVVNVSAGTVHGDVYGGSRDIPSGRTNKAPRWVNMWGGTVEGNVYGGSHNSNDDNPTNPNDNKGWAAFINMSGGTVKGSVFGAGYGGDIEGIIVDEERGGLVNGSVAVLIGKNAIENAHLTEIGSANVHKPATVTMDSLVIKGAVYAGANAVYNKTWGQHAVTGYSNIYIDGTGYNTTDSHVANYMDVGNGGLFGSGNNCEAGEAGNNILVRNYGARGTGDEFPVYRTVATIQRCDTLLLDHANLHLSGGNNITNADASATPRKTYGVLNVADALMAADGSGLVLGNNQQAVYIDSVPQVRSLYWNGGASSVYQHAAVHNNSNWQWIGVHNNDNKLYRIPSSGDPVQLAAAEENVMRFNNRSKMWVRYHDRMDNSAGVPSDTSVYGELQGFFRLRADSYDPHGEESFAYARPKFTSTDQTEPDENTADGGFLSYRDSHNFFTDGGTLYTKTKQYPYINEAVPFPDDPVRGNFTNWRRKWVYPQNSHLWYVDGTRGWGRDILMSEDHDAGRYPDKPKKTITGQTADGVGSGVISDNTYEPGKFSYFKDHIYVVGALSALDEVGPLCDSVANGTHYPLRLYRYPGGHAMSNGKNDYGGGVATSGDGFVAVSENAGPGANYGAMLNVQGGASTGASITLQGVLMDGLNGYSPTEVEFHNIPTESPYTVYDSTLVSMPLVVTHKNATLTLEGGTELMRGYNNTDAGTSAWYYDADYRAPSGVGPLTAYHGGAIFVDSLATVNVNGKVTITGNKQKLGTSVIESNVYLPTFNTHLNITGTLDAATRIGITSPNRSKKANYVYNTFSPIAVAASTSHASTAWSNNNFQDDQQWFFVNGYTPTVGDNPSNGRSTYYADAIADYPASETGLTPANTLFFGWTWANVVRKAPSAGDLSGEVTDNFSYTAINSAYDLAWLISQSAGMNGQTAIDFSSAGPIKQTADIDLQQYVWVPIGDVTQGSAFAGTYDGQAHLIKNLSIQYIGTGDRRYERLNYGLFGYVKGGKIDRTFVVSGKVKPTIPSTAANTYNLGGLVGCLANDGTETAMVSNSEAAVNIEFPGTESTPTIVAGGLVAAMTSGEIHSSMSMPNINSIYATNSGSVGGLVGSATAGTIRNSFTNAHFGVDYGSGSSIKIGGLLGSNTGATMSNCYMALHNPNGMEEPSAYFGRVAAVNPTASNINNCYVSGALNDCKLVNEVDNDNSHYPTCGEYTPVITSDEFGYMYSDNRVEVKVDGKDVDSMLFYHLNRWVAKQSDSKYAYWSRPALGEINGDLPVLMINNLDATAYQGDLRSVGTYKGNEDGLALQYGGTIRDNNELDGAILRLEAGDALFVYGDILKKPEQTPETNTKISIHEDVALLEAGSLSTYKDTYVGITFDNSFGKAWSTSGINSGLQNSNGVIIGGSYLLPRDWHMFSTPLSDAPLGFDYSHTPDGSTTVNTNTTEYTSGNGGGSNEYFNNPWFRPDNEFSWLTQTTGSEECSTGAGNYRYWMKPYATADGYFPTRRGALYSDANDSRKPKESEISNLFIVNSKETPSDEYYQGSDNKYYNRYPYGMDLYTWNEPQYHWVNFKRNGPNHWHSDNPHHHLKYVPVKDATADQNEDNLIVGRGYMAAIMSQTLLQSHGTLNGGDKPIALTAEGQNLPGWNLVGNPYHAYIDFNRLATYSTNGSVLATRGSDRDETPTTSPFYVVYDADKYQNAQQNGYLYYPANGSREGAYAGQFIHPHQGFFVLLPSAPAREENDDSVLKFSELVLAPRSELSGTGLFRSEELHYPLINLFLSSDKGCSDITVVELERPDGGGATKMKELRVGNGSFYARHENHDYAAFFAQPGIERIPLWFEPAEDDIFTISWNTANARFSSLYLVDNLTGVKYDMLLSDRYLFEAHKFDYKSRFYITFSLDEEPEDEPLEGQEVFVFHDGSQWVVTGEGDLEFVDVLGRVLMHTHVAGGQTRVTTPRVANGLYFMRLTNGTDCKVQKVIVNNL